MRVTQGSPKVKFSTSGVVSKHASGVVLAWKFLLASHMKIKVAEVVQNQAIVQVPVQLLHGSWPHSQRTYFHVEQSFVPLSSLVSHYSDV